MGARVLLLTADYLPSPWSGIGVAVARQAAALTELGVEVEVLVARDRAPASQQGERVYVLDRARCPVDLRDFDWVHVHSLRLAELAMEMRRRFGVRLAATVHGWPHLEAPANAAAARWSVVQQRLLRHCDHIVFVSAAERELGEEIVPEVMTRSSVIRHGVSGTRSRFAHSDRRGGPLVFAGRFTAAKGIDLLLATLARVTARSPHSCILAGGHGDPAATMAVERFVTAHESQCELTGWLEPARLDALFARAAAVLVPSEYEPFGLVALDALSHGTPVIASDTGGLRDVVQPHWGGQRVASRDPDAWADAVLKVLDGSDHEETAESCRRARAVAAAFAPPPLAARLAAIYGSAAGTRRRAS